MSRAASETLLGRLGKRIQELRQNQGLTQEKLANRSKISQKYLSELERGGKAPSWETLVNLSEGLGVRISVLVFGIDEDPDTEPKRLDDILAGRSREARYDLLQGFALILKAGEPKR